MPNNRLFVGNLSWNTDDQSLGTAFERFGTVTDAKVITDRDTGRSRGFGFITFEKGEDAQEAIKGMEGVDIDGRAIRVNEANERGGGSRGGGARRDDARRDDGGGGSSVVRRERGYRPDGGYSSDGGGGSW
jgi:cold-inducible RNA-binding protein